MTQGITLGYDATSSNANRLPRNIQVAGYDTEVGTTAGIKWTPEQFALFHAPLHICQLPGQNPPTSDYIDIERGAATIRDAVAWYPAAVHSFQIAERPGQRWPSVYASADNVPGVCSAFRAAGLKGAGLIVADWTISEESPELAVLEAAGDDFPLNGWQLASTQFWDVNAFLVPWLGRVSARVSPLFWHPTQPGDTFGKIAAERDANLDNLIRRTADHSDMVNLALIGEALLKPGTMYATVNP